MADLSAADVGALIGSRTSMGGGASAWGLGAGLLGGLFFGSLINGGGWFGGNRGNQYATQEQVQGMFNYSNLLDQNRDLATAISNGTAQNVAATNQIFHDLVGYVGDKYSELDRDVLGIGAGVQQAIANQNQCCCDTKMLIQNTSAQNRYDALQNTNAVIANMNNGFNDIKATLAQNKIDALQSRIQQLELQAATGNTVKYPTSMSYDAGRSPFCNCGGCGCGF